MSKRDIQFAQGLVGAPMILIAHFSQWLPPIQQGIHSPAGIAVILGICVVVGIITFLLLKWIKKRADRPGYLAATLAGEGLVLTAMFAWIHWGG